VTMHDSDHAECGGVIELTNSDHSLFVPVIYINICVKKKCLLANCPEFRETFKNSLKKTPKAEKI